MDWLQDESQLEGFHYRPGSKRDTVGIWIWAEPIMIDAANGERYAVVLVNYLCLYFGIDAYLGSNKIVELIKF